MSFLKPIINSSHWKIYSLCEVCQILWYFDDEVFSESVPYTAYFASSTISFSLPAIIKSQIMVKFIHKLVVKLHVIRTKENNDRYFERYFATRVIMDIILPPW